jgi:hypothetical protein
LLNLVAKLAGMETTKDLFAQHGQSILRDIQETVPVWTDVCAEKSQFSAFVIGAGKLFEVQGGGGSRTLMKIIPIEMK